MKKTLLLILFLFFLGAGCQGSSTNTQFPVLSKQEQVLNNQGYMNIKLNGTPIFGCADEDSLLNSYNFTADTPIGTHVTGYVCCGWLKGCTVRYE